MSNVLHPVGPNPPRVYWVRRALVLVALGIVVAGLVALVWALGARVGADDVGAEDPPAAGSQPTEQAGSGTPTDCKPADLQLAVVTDATQYAPELSPVLHASVTNSSAVPCTVDAGDVAREVVISSGADRIWSSKDCPSGQTASRQLLLDAGGRDTFDIAWARVRSATGCPTDLPAPRPGTYQVAATLLGVAAPPAVFTLQ